MRLLRNLLLLIVLLPGMLHATEKIVTLDDGSTVKVFLFYPQNMGEGPWPLCVLMSGGTANEYIARAQFWLGNELANRGWVIAVPVSPDANSFFGKNGEKIPKVVDRLQEFNDIQKGKSLLVGVSNGGSSAIEIASRDPEKYYGVVAVPGIIKDNGVVGDLKGLPMYIRIGAKDYLRWNRQLPSMIERLEEAGAKVDAELVPDESHVVALDWDDLQPWLDSIQQDPTR